MYNNYSSIEDLEPENKVIDIKNSHQYANGNGNMNGNGNVNGNMNEVRNSVIGKNGEGTRINTKL